MTPAPTRLPPARDFRLGRDTVFLIGDLLPLLDFTAVLLAAWLGTLLYSSAMGTGEAARGLVLEGGGRAALAAAVLAPFILCDRAFVGFASGGQTGTVVRCYAVRFLMFGGAVAGIGMASHALEQLPRAWLAFWFASTLLITAAVRVALMAALRHLEQAGTLAETVAVVGAGPLAERLIAVLRRARGRGVTILGVFDDPAPGAAPGTPGPATAGSIADLLELGKSSPPDWILLASANPAEPRIAAIVHRLKALAVPVAYPRAGAPLPAAAWTAAPPGPPEASLESVLPRWILTLLGLPLLALRLPFAALRALAVRALAARAPRAPRLTCTLDDCDLPQFTRLAARFGTQRFGYAVTPNADHLIRLHEDVLFRELYAGADYVLLDSRFLSRWLRRSRGQALPVCAGSDLTAALFSGVIRPRDRLVLIGGSREQAARLAARHGLLRLAHYNPPMDFIGDPAALDACVRFVEDHSPFRYCLLAVGSPQQEIVARRLKQRGIARGLALCVGSAVDFLTGDERRAPPWMRERGLEWLYRLVQAPRRMAARYLWRGPRLFGLLRRTDFVLRAPAVPALPRHAFPAGLPGDEPGAVATPFVPPRAREHERRA